MPRYSPDYIPKLRLHKPTGRAVVTLCGKDFWLGEHGTAEAGQRYNALIARWLEGGRQPLEPITAPAPGPMRVTLRAVSIAFNRWAESYYRRADGTPTGEASTLRGAIATAIDMYGKDPAEEFGPLKLKAVREAMIKKGWSRKYINRCAGSIRQMIRWAVSEELVPGETLHRLKAVEAIKRGRSPARETTKVKPIDDATIDATVKHASAVIAAMIKLQRLTGMRPGEVCVMRPCEIDRSGPVWFYRPEHHKTVHHDKAREIAIGPKAQQILAPFLSLRIDPKGYVFRPSDAVEEMRARRAAERKTPASCGNRPGTNRKPNPTRTPRDCYDKNSYRRAIARASEAAGVEAWAPNRIRHTTATEARQHFGLDGAQVVLGHSKADITEIYAEVDRTKLAQVALAIG